MHYEFLKEDTLKKAISDSESFMRSFHEPLDENERLARAEPGRVPKGKPRVTDGTIASIIKEAPKRILQQLPTGKVTVKQFPDIQDYVNAVLTDDILTHANSGGTPYSKAKNGVKKALTNGASVAYCFYNRRGDWFGADFKIPDIRDVYFEKGKTSEFDCNYMFLVAWYTVSDLEAIKHTQQELSKDKDHESEWDISVIDELIEGGTQEKDEENKSSSERKSTVEDNGFIKLVHCFQVGKKAKFYTYSTKLDKTARTWPNPDPRGVIPLHVLYFDEDFSNPLGVSLVSLSAGKQNLLDFDMQMYQYNRGLLLSPPVMKWGDVAARSIRLVPDAVIDMGDVNSGSKLETMDISNSAIRDFAQNYSLIKSQVLNESGMMDSSVSSTAGNPGFSKTDAGVDMLASRLGVSDNDMRKNTEAWLSRVYETCLNLQFSQSKGKQSLDLQIDTAKRLKLERGASLDIDYDIDVGDIVFTVDAGTTESADNEKENERLIGLLDITSKFGQLRQDKQMAIVNQIIQNSGVDDPEKLMYTDEEIEQAMQMAEMQQQQAMMPPEQAQQLPAEMPQGMPPEVPQELPPEMMQDQMPQQPMGEQQMLADDEAQAVQMLLKRGVPEEDIATALTMLRQDYTDEEVAKILTPQGVA